MIVVSLVVNDEPRTIALRSADRTTLDVIKAAGGGSWAQLSKVRLRAALPSTFAALQIAAP